MPPIVGAGFFGIEHFTPPWDVFYLPLFNLLIFFYEILFSSFGLAIIVFTIVIRTLLAPLFVRQIRSQKEMQRMQPLIREVQRKHKGNRQKISEETMALYREHGVNPAAGCLPVLLQLPLLFALYQALIRASNVVTLSENDANAPAFAELQAQLPGITPVPGSADQFNAPISGPCDLPQFDSGPYTHFLPLNCQLVDPLKLAEPINTKVAFLGGLDLAQRDMVFAISIFGFGLSALAVFAAILQFIQVKMTMAPPNPDDPTSSTQSTMLYLFPLLTIFWGGLFPSGLILYWATYTAYLIVQQYLIMGWGNLFPMFGWQPSWAPPANPPPPPRRKPGDEEAAGGRSRDGSQPANQRPGDAASGGSQKRRPQGQRRRRRGRRR